MNNNFTEPAKQAWRDIPEGVREKLLSNVHCVQCEEMVTIVDVEGKISGGDLLLQGTCKTCGGAVSRVIEQS